MRKILFLVAVLTLGACGDKNAAEQAANDSADVAVENIGGNDITAIDAATGADANMAADVEFNVDMNMLEDNGDAPVSNRD